MNPRPADYESAALPLSYTGTGVHYRAFTARSPEAAATAIVNTVGEFFVIDDDLELRATTAELLRGGAHLVAVAQSGIEGLSWPRVPI